MTGYWGLWFALTPNDSPLLLKDADTHEIVSMQWLAPERFSAAILFRPKLATAGISVSL